MANQTQIWWQNCKFTEVDFYPEAEPSSRWPALDIPVSPAKTTKTAKLLVAGDFCPKGRPDALLPEKRANEVMGGLTALLEQQNLAIVNVECPLTLSGSPISKIGPNLSAQPAWADELRQTGFDVVTLANNHIFDRGPTGVADTISACVEAGLQTVGAGCNLAEASRPLFVEVEGITVAVLAFAEHEWNIATPTQAGAWPLDPIDNHYQIRQAAQHANFVLVILHGGNEYYPLPSPRLAKTCRYFVDLGAHAVVCHHPHVSSGLEIYNSAPIVYSTGNLLFDSARPRPKEWYRGYMVELTITAGQVNALRLFPYQQCEQNPEVRAMPVSEAELFFKELIRLSEIISSAEALNQAWVNFCKAQRSGYLKRLLGQNKVERLLARIGIQPDRKGRQKQLHTLRNTIQCEAHRDVVIELLTAE